jgi:hypothetical protein
MWEGDPRSCVEAGRDADRFRGRRSRQGKTEVRSRGRERRRSGRWRGEAERIQELIVMRGATWPGVAGG